MGEKNPQNTGGFAILGQLTFLFIFVAVFALIVMFAWNYGLVWLIPFFSTMGYLNAVGLTTAGVIVHLLASFWHKRYLDGKQQKAILKAINEGKIVDAQKYKQEDAD